MKKEQAIDKLKNILDGITKDEVEYDGGWWETYEGAEFGKDKLKEVTQLIEDIYKHFD